MRSQQLPFMIALLLILLKIIAMNSMDKYKKGGLLGFLIELDKFGNRISGGKKHPFRWWTSDHTISARVGYYANEKVSGKYRPMWKLWQAIIDLAFYPVDGPYHCYQAYESEYKKDPDHDFCQGNKIAQFFLMLILVISCTPITFSLWGWKIISKIFKK